MRNRSCSTILLASLHTAWPSRCSRRRGKEREAVYEIMREGLRHAATIVPVPSDMEDQYMTWLRALVDIIERSGGGPGRERIVS
jgi:hypothetical protein